MIDEETIKKELKKIDEMSRVIHGTEPLNGIQHTLLWILNSGDDLMTPPQYVDPYGRE